MRQFVRRAILSASVMTSILALDMDATAPRAGLLAPRPGPIDRPLALVVADFDRDGIDDIVVADYQAAILNLLVGRADGTFVPSPAGPIGVGTTTISNPTTAPFELLTLDLDPEDVDADTVPNARDNCPNFLNLPETDGTQLDANHNGIGDACEVGTDSDANGTIDVTIDTDGDGVPDYDPVTATLDNCPRRPNPLQEDTETARGLDGLCGTADDNPLLVGPDGICGTGDDRIGDGIGDACKGSPDMLILNASAGDGSVLGTLRVRMNTGAGGFVSRRSYSTSIGPGAMAADDYNKDGKIDVALTNTTFKAAEVFPGLGDGQFSLPTIFNTGKGPQGVAWGDWDGDGDADFAVANRADDTLSVFVNAAGVLPSNATSTPPTFALHDAPTVLLAGSLNGDLLTDLVVLGQGSPTSPNGWIQAFLGSPGGALLPSSTIDLGPGKVPRTGILSDLDGNGTLDLALADFAAKEVSIFAGAGDGSFTGPITTVPVRDQPTDLATLDLSPAGGVADLAVLQFNARVDLLKNGGALAFAAAATTPASIWKDTRAMAFFGADLASAGDLVLLDGAAGRFDVLSGIGDNSFRYQSSQTIGGLTASLPADASFMQVADISYNNRPDMAIVDPTAGKLVMITNQLTGVLKEEVPITIPTGAGGISSGNLIASIVDYDRDGVPNTVDDCPTIYNPPGCAVDDPTCPQTIACTDDTVTPTDCTPGDPATTDPLTGQCDSDRNGIGDHCQVASATCVNIDTDFDLVPQYDVNALKKAAGQNDFDGDTVPNLADNCPTIANSTQADGDANGIGDACQIQNGSLPADPDGDGVPTWNSITNAVDNCPDVPNPDQADNDADHVGNACVIAKALDNCPSLLNLDQGDTDGDGVGNACATPPPDLLIPNPVDGRVTLLAGDGSGFLRQPTASPLDLLPGAVAAVTGHFSLDCVLPVCFSSQAADIAVIARGAAAGSADDNVTLFVGDDQGGYARKEPAAAAGDPDGAQVLVDQSACSNPGDPLVPGLRYDPDRFSDLVVVSEPGASQIRILIGSNMNFIDPLRSPLVQPVGHTDPLPTPADLRAVANVDLNRDGLSDLVAVAGPPGGPTRLQIYIGLGNGLFYTDPSLDPDPLADELDLPVTGFINIQSDSFYPEIALFSRTDQAPFTLLNVLPERADIDRSGRVDGFDLVALARAFGATRGEDFILDPDDTFRQTGSGWSKHLLGSGSRSPGQDLASAGGCATATVLLSGLYGLPVDINLDGVVDGVDLALLASRFGDTLP
jgi:hypothetical protein